MTYEKLVAVYDTLPHAEKAVSALRSAGYKPEDISIVSQTTLEATGAHDIELGEPGLWRRLFGTNVLDRDATIYGRAVEVGGAVLSVRVPQSEVARVTALLDKLHPDVAPSTATTAKAVAPDVLRLAEEQLNVGKRMFHDGTTRIRRFVTEKPVEASVSLHEEHAEVLRRAVANPDFITDVDWSDKMIEVAESAERAVVSKSARIIEEVVIRKTGTDHVETIRDKIRRQQVDIEHFDAEGKKKAA